MEETDGENEWTPVRMVNLVYEFLSNDCSESFIEASFETLWRLIGNLKSLLKKTKREFRMLLASNPKSEILMDCL